MAEPKGSSPFFTKQPAGGLGAGSVPAPPPEVKIRTFKSDTESMMQSGGGAPQYQSVRGPVAMSGSEVVLEQENENKSSTGTIIMTVAVILLLGGIGYFAYRILTENNAPAPQNPPPPSAPSPLGALTPPTPPPTNAAFVHHSFFKKQADQLLTLTVPVSAAANTYDLATFSQRIRDIVEQAGGINRLFEATSKDSQGNDLVVQQILQATDLGILGEKFMDSHFLNDATLFVWRDATGTWPGFVFGLKPTENWLFIQNDVAKLESSPKLANLFISDPGKPSQSGFKDVALSGQHSRILTYGAPQAVIVYGLFHNYFVLSTSEEGLKQAIARLVE